MDEITSETEINRRNILRAIGVGTVGVTALTGASRATYQPSEMAGFRGISGQQESPSLEFEQQRSDGESLVISISVDEDRTVMIQDDAKKNTFYATKEIPGGTHEEEFTIELDEPIKETQLMQVWLFAGELHESEVITVQEAMVAVNEELDATLGRTFVEANPDAGFNYPYYLFSPTNPNDSEIPLLVEPNNTGTISDDFGVHKKRAKSVINRGASRPISEDLGVPLLVPIFPRPKSEPVDATTYTHALDRDTLEIEGNDLERIDLQLLHMVEDAKARLEGETYSFTDQIILNGFSASGNFVDRFTVLHPERVLSVTAGGLNGTALLPLKEWQGKTLDYHVGIADLEELTGESVDVSKLNGVNQLLYMGSEDTNDTIPYDDAWTPALRELALSVYGEDMVQDRFPQCQRAYEKAGVDAQFKIYDGLGHRPAEESELVEFHRSSINGDDVTGFGEQLGTSAVISVTTDSPKSGEEITFDASDSAANSAQIVNYSWEFGDEETAVGEAVTHTYSEPGTYTVTLTVVTDQGTEQSTTQEVIVEQASTNPTDSSDNPDSENSSENNSGSVPGFGVGAAVAGLGGAASLVAKRIRDQE